MKKLLFVSAILLFASPAIAEDSTIVINVDRVCAAVVGIPYASDNFTEQEFQHFKNCVRFMRKFDGGK
jgi:hypothetical protein